MAGGELFNDDDDDDDDDDVSFHIVNEAQLSSLSLVENEGE